MLPSLTLLPYTPIKQNLLKAMCMVIIPHICCQTTLTVPTPLEMVLMKIANEFNIFGILDLNTIEAHCLHLTFGTPDGLIFFLSQQLFLSVLHGLLFYCFTYCSFL